MSAASQLDAAMRATSVPMAIRAWLAVLGKTQSALAVRLDLRRQNLQRVLDGSEFPHDRIKLLPEGLMQDVAEILARRCDGEAATLRAAAGIKGRHVIGSRLQAGSDKIPSESAHNGQSDSDARQSPHSGEARAGRGQTLCGRLAEISRSSEEPSPLAQISLDAAAVALPNTAAATYSNVAQTGIGASATIAGDDANPISARAAGAYGEEVCRSGVEAPADPAPAVEVVESATDGVGNAGPTTKISPNGDKNSKVIS
jgi:hypothetical protein